jgi:hypothetical protein
MLEKIGFGGLFLLEYRINELFTAGLRTGVYYGFDTPLTVEPLFFFRLYAQTFGPGLLFMQADGGMVILIYDEDTYPAFAGGATVGYRIPLKKFFIEPYVRLGYPYVAGFGFAAGYSF